MAPLSPCVAFLVFSCPAFAQVLRVPSQHQTISAALAAASSGTTILVAPGSYTERITWPSVDGIRLIAEQGHAKTTIDAQKGGTVITFTGSLTRTTLLEGFTITGGFLNTSAGRNNGAGIYISGASPTIRSNHITGNASDGTRWNYGGAIHIGSSAKPRIEGNLIDGNELRNGSWNYGAGIYIASGAQPEIIGNVIQGNKNLTPSMSSGGRGHGAGIYANGSGTIASNLIVGNICASSSWNYGAGVKISTSAKGCIIANNTIVANTCSGGTWNQGAGLHTDLSSSTTATFVGNIVVANVAQGGSFTGAGGLHSGITGGTLQLDYNDVWNNTGGDYSGFTAGPSSISKDPLFVSASDYHLTKLSPCVEAMPSTWLPSHVASDMDNGPRHIDGNQDGLMGDGARLDIGADEYSDARLTMQGTAKLGTTLTVKLSFTTTPAVFLNFLDVQVGSTFVDPYGELLLSLGMLHVASGTVPANLQLSIPNDQRFVGLTVYQQALVLPLPLRGIGQLSNLSSFTIY